MQHLKLLTFVSFSFLLIVTAGCSNNQESLGATCGNGIREEGEGCDDGNKVATDGCDSQCQVTRGYSCHAAALALIFVSQSVATA